jgi:periplasmic protein TonB
MFESVRQETEQDGMRYAASLFVSLGVHALLICALVVVPLVFFNVLQAQELLTFLIEPPQPPPEPPAPRPPVQASAARQPGELIRYGDPVGIPKGIPPVNDADSGVVDPGIALLQIPGLEGSGLNGGIGKSFAGMISEPPRLEEPKKPTTKPATPIRVGVLEQSKLIYKMNPIYPVLAVKAHVQGSVILEAVVNEEGDVSTLKVLSGHILLVDAAMQAVKQWRYSPTILNGEPVPVIATVTVVFRLNQ